MRKLLIPLLAAFGLVGIYAISFKRSPSISQAKQDCIKFKYKAKRYNQYMEAFLEWDRKDNAHWQIKELPTTTEGWNKRSKAEKNLQKEYNELQEQRKSVTYYMHLSEIKPLLLHLGIKEKEIIERYKYHGHGDPAGKYYLKARKMLADKKN